MQKELTLEGENGFDFEGMMLSGIIFVEEVIKISLNQTWQEEACAEEPAVDTG